MPAWALWRSDVFLVGIGCAVSAGALAFLPWNAVRARVFLGDVGSYGLGAALAVLAAAAVIRGVPVEAAIGPLASVPGRYCLDASAAGPVRRALARGAPQSRLPAVV